jgi:uncharacterized membrane protein
MLTEFDWKDIAIRAIKTGVQTYLAAWALTQDPFSQAGIIAPVAATVSAVWNVISQAMVLSKSNTK